MAEKIDITIIGAGAVGLAVAEKLASPDRSLFVIEKNPGFGMESSSRNSEVIHSGIYYPTGSLKHKLCIKGNELLYRICEQKGIRHLKTGKYIIATDEKKEEYLQSLYENAKRNVVPGITFVSCEKIKNEMPGIECTAALFSPTTGILDTHGLMEYFSDEAKNKGAEVVFSTEVIGIEKNSGQGFTVSVRESDGRKFSFDTKIIINCAGLNSDDIAKMAGIDINKNNYNLKYCKGTYFRLRNHNKYNINRPVYPAVGKESVSLGIHLTPDLDRGIRIGPDAEYIKREIDYNIDHKKKGDFLRDINKIFPEINKEQLQPDTSGIRPKLQGPGQGFRDFVIKEEFEGFINLIGIDSPGLTASPAIAGMVKGIIDR